MASLAEPGPSSPPRPLEASCVRGPALPRVFPSPQHRPHRPPRRSGLSTRFRARRSWLCISIPVQQFPSFVVRSTSPPATVCSAAPWRVRRRFSLSVARGGLWECHEVLLQPTTHNLQPAKHKSPLSHPEREPENNRLVF